MEASGRPLYRRTTWQAVGLDVALAALCASAAWTLAAEITAQHPSGFATTATLVAGVHGASVGLRRVAPWVMLGVLTTTSVAYALIGLPVVFLGPAVLVATYSIAAWQPRRVSLAALVGIETVLAVLVLLGPGSLGADSWLFYAGLVAGAWFLGDVSRRWRALAEENGRQVRELEEARAELAAQALTLERLRIARELHDVIAHSMSMVAMHAGAARLAVGRDLLAQSEALTVVERTTRAALAEMRRLVTVLRDHPSVETLPLSPAPGLGDLPRLVAEMAAVGLVVDVHTTGDLSVVPPGLSLTAERVLQESLTNAVRHVGPTKVEVRVEALDDELRLSVENAPGAGPSLAPALSGGQGLTGMRERVQLYGGTLDAGPTPSGGWRVAARIPCEGAVS